MERHTAVILCVRALTHLQPVRTELTMEKTCNVCAGLGSDRSLWLLQTVENFKTIGKQEPDISQEQQIINSKIEDTGHCAFTVSV